MASVDDSDAAVSRVSRDDVVLPSSKESESMQNANAKRSLVDESAHVHIVGFETEQQVADEVERKRARSRLQNSDLAPNSDDRNKESERAYKIMPSHLSDEELVKRRQALQGRDPMDALRKSVRRRKEIRAKERWHAKEAPVHDAFMKRLGSLVVDHGPLVGSGDGVDALRKYSYDLQAADRWGRELAAAAQAQASGGGGERDVDVDDALQTMFSRYLPAIRLPSETARFEGDGEPRLCVVVAITEGDADELDFFLDYVPGYLNQTHKGPYHVIVVEQKMRRGGASTQQFNRGRAFNAAVRISMDSGGSGQRLQCDYFAFHDAMLLPADGVEYRWPSLPIHLAVAVEEHDYKLPQVFSLGGVFAISKDHYLDVNGYPNSFVRWGGADLTLFLRLMLVGIEFTRPSPERGTFRTLEHEHPSLWRSKVRNTRRSRQDFLDAIQGNFDLATDGVADVEFQLVSEYDISPHATRLIVRL
jgi:N-terminal domain of galactosyltransferase